jgi:MHS family shikimate/dehydroshikimate transporter-like MFS transporter
MTTTSQAPAPTAGIGLGRVAIAALIGSALEWYDFYLYAAAAALVFNRIVFPTGNLVVGTLLAFGTAAVGYFVRPLGGAVFGSIGDRLGRRRVLVMTLLIMGGSSFLMAFIPGYAQAGIFSPIILVTLRIIQGFGAGAEYGSAAVLSAEFATPRRRGLQAAWPGTGVYLGLLMSSGAIGLAALLPEDQFLSWGWRIPFAASAVVVVAALIIRLRLSETPVFIEAVLKLKTVTKPPLIAVFRTEKKAIFALIGAQIAQGIVSYTFLTFLTSYVSTTLALPSSWGPFATAIASVVTMFTLPFFGHLSDRYGRKPILLFGLIFAAAFSFPAFWLIDTKTFVGLVIAVVVGLGVGVGALFGPQGSFFSELFTAPVRVTGLAFSREIGGALSGGFVPVIAVALVAAAGGLSWPIALFCIAGMAIIGLPAVLLAPETRGRNLKATTKENLAASTNSFEE